LFAGQGRDWRPKFELSHHQSLYGLVAAGLGVTVMPTSALPPDAAERFHTALLIEPEQSRELGLIYVKGNTLSPAVEAFASCAADRQAEL
jgi:DNA-binding transcriptional LysR family regulator